MKYITLLSFLFLCLAVSSQEITWEELSPMPERVTNNAVTEAMVNGVPFVYSFSGIDSTKACGNPHLHSFRYDTQNDVWENIAPLPDPLGGKIAAGASTVKNKIYIIGGYYVSDNCGESSSDDVHIYNPETNTYEADGATVPVAIDDQVQVVWRDSLIYVITGWSNNTNVTNVQIYNPTEDTWMEGTPINNSIHWRVFGGSGVIIDDVIYYIGGASPTCNFNSCFPPTKYIRKGVINPDDPTEITWEGNQDPFSQGYRMAATTFDGKAIWIGGSQITYNFDGIDYNGSGGVAPLDRVTILDPTNGFLNQESGLIPSIMDLRGIAKISNNEFIIAGGMEANQWVTNKTFKITINDLTDIDEINQPKISLYPNPTSDFVKIEMEGDFEIVITDINGKRIESQLSLFKDRIELSHLQKGVYFVQVLEKGKLIVSEKIIKL